MTDFFKQWLLGVCITVIFCAVIFALVPNTNMKKSVRLVCTAAIAAAIFLPFAKASLDLNFKNSMDNELYLEELSSDSIYNLTAILSDEVTEKLDSVLNENGYPDCEINILTSQTESGLITVKRADIKVPDSKRVDDLTQDKLYELLGENAIIVFS